MNAKSLRTKSRSFVLFSIVIYAAAISGCYSIVAYSPKTMDIQRAEAIIEQVLMEEPLKFRPQSVEFTPEYVAILDGYSSKRNGSAIVLPNTPLVFSSGSSISKEVGTRIYYSSIGELVLYHKNNHYAMRPFNKEGKVIHTAVTTSETKAYQYIDAMNSLRIAQESKGY